MFSAKLKAIRSVVENELKHKKILEVEKQVTDREFNMKYVRTGNLDNIKEDLVEARKEINDLYNQTNDLVYHNYVKIQS
jgi:hypothetical protein